ncbi:MAG TPA: hypothetical protein H9705_06095 [Candidatus Fusicatenibacter intestinigallinarum]|uniref:Uncharacterized protein n=1 Tax=Candidatus Fusicatenibacter intestinigallinarum TaxID=2838598 RepID=A0A9D2NB24_9FIRM|nr:hypothetical protein [Candidatus Fusicatenibacter intestinigallinarum]
MTGEIADQIRYSEKTTLSEFIRMLNSLRDEEHVKCLTFQSLIKHLVEEGCLAEDAAGEDGKTRRTITPKGIVFGIFSEKRFNQSGDEYEVIYYGEKAQRQLVKKMLNEWKEE